MRCYVRIGVRRMKGGVSKGSSVGKQQLAVFGACCTLLTELGWRWLEGGDVRLPIHIQCALWLNLAALPRVHNINSQPIL